ncbi:hypothetical protein I7I53_02336 [Histoplasma capsulatum var. duboisii H88]|uniref:Uncharacterized protein n=1 Tax=Ajellomyces capsulatus (strain H88) TaxID=544711 RepID=A0A8A1LL92_AJEC8|nr:hypothetical protein I7I53_02336 [Histoplasma capsulatum var. duboisii H88]
MLFLSSLVFSGPCCVNVQSGIVIRTCGFQIEQDKPFSRCAVCKSIFLLLFLSTCQCLVVAG